MAYPSGINPNKSRLPLIVRLLLVFFSTFFVSQVSAGQVRYVQQRTANGVVEGVVSADGKVRTFKGIPYAAPPVGPLRWKAPQPVTPWKGVRKAVDYGARCMQTDVFSDMQFHDDGPSEDCLYLNLWMPDVHSKARLPVMVWIYGGGFRAGTTSEPRQDGGNLSKKGVLVVSMNYRLGIFGFFSLPELAKESGHDSSGNYGLMDQVAALKWVKENIASFGGDPDNVTIFGESAGSSSVSALMASPLAKGLFNHAIGESGAAFSHDVKTHSETERVDADFAKFVFGTDSLEALRAKSTATIEEAGSREAAPKFSINIDGYFLPESARDIFAAGKQSHVPLIAGWNLDEGDYDSILKDDAPTRANLEARVRTLYGDNADALLQLYPGTTEAEVKRAAQDLAGDRFTALHTWEWLEVQVKTGQAPVYRYRFEQTLPLPAGSAPNAEPQAPHSGEIEYVFEVLPSKDLPWRPEDEKVSDLMSTYWTNFAKTGDPNGEGLPHWPTYAPEKYEVMHINTDPHAAPDEHRARYELLSKIK